MSDQSTVRIVRRGFSNISESLWPLLPVRGIHPDQVDAGKPDSGH